MRLIALLAFGGVVAGVLVAAPPTITELQPRGAERGKPFQLTIAGKDLPEGARIQSSMPASFTPVLVTDPNAPMTAPGRAVTFLVEPKADITPGIYSLRLEASTGISNVLLFSVGTFPERTEEESAPFARPNLNDNIETAEPVQSTPITINGTLKGAERDLFRVYGKAGERRVFEVEARRAGSAIDPVLRILDGNGKMLARSEDAAAVGLDSRLEFTFPREGNYYVEVHDARFSRQIQNFYRLKMGAYRYFDGVFPLGGKRGESAALNFIGGNDAAPVKANVDLSAIPAHQDVIMVPPPSKEESPMLLAVSDFPETMEPANAVQAPIVINGRLDKAGEIDKYRVSVQPGDQLLIEMQARELGTSKIEGIITAYGPDGKKIDSAGDKPLPEDVFAVQGTSRTSSDPFLNLKVPEGVNEITVGVEDLAQRGGPNYAYRLVVRKEPEDFRLTVITPFVNIPAGGTAAVNVAADRRGYDGPIQLSIPKLPAGVSVQGGVIPREYVDATNTRSFNRRGVLVLSANTEVALGPGDLIVYGEGKTEKGEILTRRARGVAAAIEVTGATAQGVVDRQRAITAPWLGLDLPFAIASKAEATLEIEQINLVRMEEGDRFDFRYQWKSPEFLNFPRNLNVEVIGARDIRVTSFERESPYSGTFSISTTKATDPARYDVIARGRVKTGNGDEDIYALPVALHVTARGGENATAQSR